MSSVIDKDKVKKLRKARGWNQSDLSKHSEVDKTIISRVERGNQFDYRASVLIKIARSLNVPVDMLISSEEKTEFNELTSELEGAINQLKQHKPKIQSQVAAIIYAFLNTLEEED